jgi:hypothetical protein
VIPVSALIEEPARGTWVADTVTIEQPTGVFEVGEATWTGSIAPPGAVLDGSRYRCRIVGGKGKLGNQLRERNYNGPVAYSRVAQDIIKDAGELAGSITVQGQAGYYERVPGMTAGQSLTELCAAAGCTWWVGRDGLVNVAASRDASTVDELNANRIAYDADGTVVLNETHAADVTPGQTLDGKAITALRWSLTPERLTVECAFSSLFFPDQRDRFYERTYSAKVHQQNADGTVDVIANGLFAMNKVKLLSGWPGSRITVKPGELVSVGFFNGNRSQPYAVAGEQGGDGRPVALLDDAVSVALPPFTFVGTVSGAPASGVMTALVAQTLGKVIGPGSQRIKTE